MPLNLNISFIAGYIVLFPLLMPNFSFMDPLYWAYILPIIWFHFNQQTTIKKLIEYIRSKKK
jgi:hypothetical protein